MQTSDDQPRRIGCLGVLGIVFATAVLSVLLTLWAVNSQLFGSRFTPVSLDSAEHDSLNQKLHAVGLTELAQQADTDFEPEPYTENADARDITLSEREVNALVARQDPRAAERIAIDLAEDLISARLRVPLDPDLPFLGGKVLKASAGVSISYANDTPRVVLRGVSVWGVPVPNAWLGNTKNIDLIDEFSADDGFWSRFADGIDDVEVRDGELYLKLKP